jgi:transcriptional antiterminator NusG
MEEKKEDKTLTSAKPRAVAKKLFTPMMKEWQPVSPKMPARPVAEENPLEQSESDNKQESGVELEEVVTKNAEKTGSAEEGFSENAGRIGDFSGEDELSKNSSVLEDDLDSNFITSHSDNTESKEVESEEKVSINLESEASGLEADEYIAAESKASQLKEDEYINSESEASELEESEYSNFESKASEPEKDEYTNSESGASELEENEYSNFESKASEPEEDEYTNSESGASELEEDENINSESGASELEEDEYRNSESEVSGFEEDEYTNSESEASEFEEDDYTNSESKASEFEEDEYTNSESKASEFEEDEYTNSESKASEFEEDEYTNSESETFESEEDAYINSELEESEGALYQEDRETEDVFSEETEEDAMPEAPELIDEEPHSRVALSDNKSGMGMGWYVVHTYSGYENKVKANIEKAIENRHLENEILEVRVPLQEVMEVKNGVEKSTQKKLFPGYVLLHMDADNNDAWYVVRNTRGVTGFVGPGSKPVPLTDEELRALDFGNEVALEYAEGDVIHVVAGVWKDTVGTIQKIDAGRQTVTINVEMFGRETPVEIHFSDIKKMWD